jgi:hypothetical protein
MSVSNRNCETCNSPIPLGRIQAIPDVTTCVKCSRVKPYVGFMDWHHKTAPEIVLISSENKENIRRAARISSRSR